MSTTNRNEKFLAAIKENRLDLVNECLSLGASLAYTDWAGCSALHLASSGSSKDSRLEICRLLLSYGANTNQLTKLRKSPLHLAVQFGNLQTAEALLKTSIDSINSTDLLLMTPIHWATVKSDHSMLQLLLNNSKICLNTLKLRDKFKRDCFDIARKNLDWSILERLESVQNELMEKDVKVSSNIRQIEEDLKSQAGYHKMDTRPCTSKNIRGRVFFSDSDDSDSDNEQCKKMKKRMISSSPVLSMQNIEDTLLWLQNQALANTTSEDYIMGDKEFFLTDAGILALEHMNKINPIEDDQRLMLKLAKNLEQEESDNEQQDKYGVSDEWIFGNDLNLDGFI